MFIGNNIVNDNNENVKDRLCNSLSTVGRTEEYNVPQDVKGVCVCGKQARRGDLIREPVVGNKGGIKSRMGDFISERHISPPPASKMRGFDGVGGWVNETKFASL